MGFLKKVQAKAASKIGTAMKGSFKAYKSDPSDFTTAANYAYTIAKKKGADIFIFKGNSYGSAIFRIAYSDSSDEIHKQTAMRPKSGFAYAKVSANGEVFRMVW